MAAHINYLFCTDAQLSWRHPKTPRTITALSNWKIRGGPQLGHHYAERVSGSGCIFFQSEPRWHKRCAKVRQRLSLGRLPAIILSSNLRFRYKELTYAIIIPRILRNRLNSIYIIMNSFFNSRNVYQLIGYVCKFSEPHNFCFMKYHRPEFVESVGILVEEFKNVEFGSSGIVICL